MYYYRLCVTCYSKICRMVPYAFYATLDRILLKQVTGLFLCLIQVKHTGLPKKYIQCVIFLFQIYTVNLNNPDDCGAKFRSNRNLGVMFWLMIMAGTLLKTTDDRTLKDNNIQLEKNDEN